MSHAPTVTVRYTQAISQAAAKLGFSLPDTLQNAFAEQERVSLELQGEIWESFCSQADDALVGVRFGLALEVGHLDTAGMVLMSCDTVADAMESLIDYYPIVGEGGTFNYEIQGDECIVSYEPQYQVRKQERVEAALASLLQLSRWSSGGKLKARRLEFAHAALDDNRLPRRRAMLEYGCDIFCCSRQNDGGRYVGILATDIDGVLVTNIQSADDRIGAEFTTKNF